MKRLVLKTVGKDGESEILCGRGIFKSELSKRLASFEKKLIFTDSNVFALYGKQLSENFPDIPVFAMPAGEEYKTPETLLSLLQKMAEEGLNRTSCLVAFGGGVVGDIGGLAASLYMRGICCIQVPTTLLAQVDSSVGGKTAVDFMNVKNLVGAFYQPQCVIADSDFFKTLPLREIRCGLGEIIKHGALCGKLFDKISTSDLSDLEVIAGLVPDNIAYKISVVERDERETGLRKCLNLAHTTAHAVELGDGTRSHGEYVLLGILIEAEIAKRHLPCDVEYLDKLKAIAKNALGTLPEIADYRALAKHALLDKKNVSADKIVLTVPVKKSEYALLELDKETYFCELSEIGGAL